MNAKWKNMDPRACIALVKTGMAVVLLALLGACLDKEAANQDSAANTEFGDEYWAELAQNYAPFEKPDPPLGAAYTAEDLQYVGSWGPVQDWPLIATGAANLPDGRIAAWSSQTATAFTGNLESTTGTIFNPQDNSFSNTPSSSHDMFCAGISMLEDGRVFIAGGGKTVSATSVFDNEQFSEIESMSLTRWYPTSTTLPTGQVLTSLGTIAAPYPELWTDGSGWDLVENISMQSILDEDDVEYRDWYPALNVAPDGSLFHPGHMPELFSVHMNDAQTVHSHGARDDSDDESRLYNTTVVYDIGKVLFAGGGENTTPAAYVMDLNGTEPLVTPTGAMKYARSMQNSIVMPNGEVLVIGGNTSGIQFSDEGTVLEPEMWNSELGSWRVMAPHDRPRNYHSTALLLKDGRVLAAGGGLCGECATNHQNGEIFTPPYLYNPLGELKDRPAITGGAAEALPGDTISLTGSDDIVTFNMLRLVAITHHHTTDQRLVPAPFARTGTGEYELTMNSNSNVLIPGYYWIFGLDADGTPSEGHTIQVKVAAENQASVEADTSPNVAYEYYEEQWSDFSLPDFSTLTPVKTGTQADFSLQNKERNNNYAFRFTGKINAALAGDYTFYLASDDGSKLFINGELVVDHDGPHSLEAQEQQTTITLAAGQHDIEVHYFEIAGGDALLVSWQGPQLAKQPVQAIHLGSPLERVSINVENSTPGQVGYEYFEGNWTVLPEFDSLIPVKIGTGAGFSLEPRERDSTYGFRYTALLNVDEAGTYTFFTRSDDGSRLVLDGLTVVENDGLHAPLTRQGSISLSAGYHELEVQFFEYFGGDSLQVEWQGPSFTRQTIAFSALAAPGTASTSTGGSTDSGGSSTTGSTTSGTSTAGSPAGSAGLVNYSYYEGGYLALPDFSTMTPVKQGESAGFELGARNQDDFYAFRFSGKLLVPTDGSYNFYSRSDDGSRIIINGTTVVLNDNTHPPIEKQGSISLTSGEHDIEVEFFEYAGGHLLEVSWAGPGFGKQLIPATALSTNTLSGNTTTDGGSTEAGTSEPPQASGINYEYFEGQWNTIPDFSTLTPLKSGEESTFTLFPRTSNDNYAFRYAASFTVTAEGDYTFFTTSDDGSRLYIDGELVVDNDGLHANRERSGTTTLTTGEHHVLVTFFERTGLDSLEVEWAGPGVVKQALSNADLRVAHFDFNASTTGGNAGGSTDAGSTDAGGNAAPPLAASDLHYEYYEGVWSSLPDFDTLTAVSTGNIANFSLLPSNGVKFYAYRFTGKIDIDATDIYTFYTASNDGTQLLIDGNIIVNNDGRHALREQQGSVSLTAGVHDIELRYFQSNGSEALDVSWSSTGFGKQAIPSTNLYSP